MLEGRVEVVDHAHRHLEPVELGRVVLVGDRVVGDAGGVGLAAGIRVGVQRHALPRQGGEGLGQERGRDVSVHEERLGGVADAGPVGLGVHRDRERLVEVGGTVDVDVAVADARLDDGHRRLGDDGLDQVGTAARDEQVDQAAGGHQGAHGAVAALEEADGVAGQALALEGGAQHGHGGAVGVGGGAAPAQDDGVAGLQAEARGVDGDVGAGLVDHPDDAHRHADLADLEAVGQRGAAHHLADGVGQGGDVAQRLGDGGDPRGVEAQAVLEAVGHPVLAAPGEVSLVGGDDVVGRGLEVVGQGAQGGVLLGAGHQGEPARGGAGGLGELADPGDVCGVDAGGAVSHASKGMPGGAGVRLPAHRSGGRGAGSGGSFAVPARAQWCWAPARGRGR